MPTILVTGSSGMIGTALMKRLFDNDKYVAVGCDRVPNRWERDVDEATIVCNLQKYIPKRVNPDLIIHLAANARVHDLVKDPELAYDNIRTTETVLECARRNDADVILASSREVYGEQERALSAEDEADHVRALSPYTASKFSMESMGAAYHQCYDIGVSILRFSNVYGKYDDSDRVIPLWIQQARRGEDLTVYGQDKLLDFTYITDTVDGIMLAIDKFPRANGEVFNIASGQGTTLVEAAKQIVKELDAESDIVIEENRTGEVEQYVADITKARNALKYKPTWTLDMGIKVTTDWYAEHADIVGAVDA